MIRGLAHELGAQALKLLAIGLVATAIYQSILGNLLTGLGAMILASFAGLSSARLGSIRLTSPEHSHENPENFLDNDRGGLL